MNTAQDPTQLPAHGRILVADDGAANRLVITTLLRKAGYAVEAVDDGVAAVAALRDGDYALILMDARMPVMDGLEATQAIRAMAGPKSRLPILALTADASLESHEACLAAGMDDFISKPVEKGRLLDTVERWLAGPVPAVAEPPLPPLLDERLLGTLVENTDADTMKLVVEAFFAELPRHAGKIDLGRRSGGLPLLKDVGHTLKSGARLIGAVRLADALADLERAANRDDAESALAWAQTCLGLFAETRTAYLRKGLLIEAPG